MPSDKCMQSCSSLQLFKHSGCRKVQKHRARGGMVKHVRGSRASLEGSDHIQVLLGISLQFLLHKTGPVSTLTCGPATNNRKRPAWRCPGVHALRQQNSRCNASSMLAH